MEETTADPEELGVAVALEKICSLESRLRQAIQSTHSLHRSFGRDMGAVDREREALLLIREHLELLEDKLREYRTMSMDPKGYDDKAIALSQLDGLRKDLLRTAKDRVDYVLYNKDVVKDILAFADTGSGDETLPERSQEAGALPSHLAAHSPPLSPVMSSDENESYTAYNGGSREFGSHLGTSTSATVSPYGPREDLQVHVDEYQENLFPYPAPASTPSIRMSQQTREYNAHRLSEADGGFVPHMREPSQDFRHKSEPGRDLISASHNFGGTHTAKGLKSSGLSAFNSLASSNTDYHMISSRPPSSHVGSCQTGREEIYGSAYHHDPTYGGKLSLTSFKGKEQAQVAKPPLPPAAAQPDRPRIVHDPSYAEEQSRLMKFEADEDVLPIEPCSVSPIRTSLRKRIAEQQLQRPQPARGPKAKRLLGYLGSCLKLAVAGIVSAATAVTIVVALQSSPAYVPIRQQQLRNRMPLLQQQSRPRRNTLPDSLGRPRADGHLVPDWMHKPQSHFKSTEWPPTGALTATAAPPSGEMFPVIPPPASQHAKG